MLLTCNYRQLPTVVTSNATTNLTATSNQQIIYSYNSSVGTPAIVNLPSVTTLNVGQEYRIVNQGADPINILRFNGFQLGGSLLQNTSTTVICTGTSNEFSWIRMDSNYQPILPSATMISSIDPLISIPNNTLTDFPFVTNISSGFSPIMISGGNKFLIKYTAYYTIETSVWFSTNPTGIRGIYIYNNQCNTMDITNVTTSMGQITYTYTNFRGSSILIVGQIVTITGVVSSPLNAFNISGPIYATGSNSFTILSGATGTYTSGGSAVVSGNQSSDERDASTSSPTHVETSIRRKYLLANSIITVKLYQNSGGNLNLITNSNTYGIFCNAYLDQF